ncbi:hypothetical protein [Candidatus Soleaferrea massiliensis]|uniref:hypothetical protein n=1 Tax=Candidatus Soleaferrea massiliensis TaxID=1470354 RepID=UPI0012E02CF8|nr:hypothetical protein [Candidatus Soleaferrea massiliensis]
MKRYKVIGLFTLLAMIILELLPFGAVCNFAVAPDSGGGTIRQTFSYFDMTPFGYANFGPLLTAVLSAAFFLLFIVFLFAGMTRRRLNALFGLSVAAVITSVFPLFFGLSYYSLTGLAISLLLVLMLFILQLMKRYAD